MLDLRDRFVVPAVKLHPSTKLTFDQLALVETLAIGCHAVDRSQLAAGENCLVIGAGPIGPIKPFLGADLRVAGSWLLLLSAAFGAVTYSAVGLYQRRINRLARRVRAAAARHRNGSP